MSLGILVAVAPCCVFYATRHQIYWRLKRDDMVFVSILIWYHIHRQTHKGGTETNWLTHIYEYILTPPVMCTQQLLALHWMNDLLIQNFTLQMSAMYLLLKNCSLAELIYLLIRFKKTMSFLWNTRNIDRNCVNEQGTHTHTSHTERKITLERVS